MDITLALAAALLAAAMLVKGIGSASPRGIRVLRVGKPVLEQPEDVNASQIVQQWYDEENNEAGTDEKLTKPEARPVNRRPVNRRRNKAGQRQRGQGGNRASATTESEDGSTVVPKQSYIIGGKLSWRGQFPSLVGMDIDDDFFCGGSLLTQLHVLTAGHCAYDSKKFSVYMGAQDRDVFESGRVSLETSRKIVHPKFNSESLQNDIAIVQLPYRVQTNNYIKLMRLPNIAKISNSFLGNKVIASGWGRTSDDVEEVSSVMYNVQLEVVSLEDCVQTYGSNSIFRTNLCATGGEGQATCQGDSGGPLVMKDTDGQWLQIGIVSYGAATGCELGYPDVFTRVTSYLGWIAAHTETRPALHSGQIRNNNAKLRNQQQRNQQQNFQQQRRKMQNRPLIVSLFN